MPLGYRLPGSMDRNEEMISGDYLEKIFIVTIISLIFVSVLAPGAWAQSDPNFCPGDQFMSAQEACLSCAQTRTCNQDTRCIRATCCLQKCYPACAVYTSYDCSGISCSCDVGGGDLTWIVVVGVGALVVIGGAIAVSRGKRKDTPPAVKPAPVKPEPGKKDEKEKKEATQYILQLSNDVVKIGKDSPAKVIITVWKQVGNAAPVLAPEAAIMLSIKPENEGVKVIPSKGQGKLESTFSLVGTASATELTCTVTASAGKTGTSAVIRITVDQQMHMEFY